LFVGLGVLDAGDAEVEDENEELADFGGGFAEGGEVQSTIGNPFKTKRVYQKKKAGLCQFSKPCNKK
jgi:hypothetical protein